MSGEEGHNRWAGVRFQPFGHEVYFDTLLRMLLRGDEVGQCRLRSWVFGSDRDVVVELAMPAILRVPKRLTVPDTAGSFHRHEKTTQRLFRVRFLDRKLPLHKTAVSSAFFARLGRRTAGEDGDERDECESKSNAIHDELFS